jgi:hypothetical protein
MSKPSRLFLYAEFQLSAPFTEAVWKDANPAMHTVPGLRSKTWLSGIHTTRWEDSMNLIPLKMPAPMRRVCWLILPKRRMRVLPSNCSMAMWWRRPVKG